EEHEEHRPWWRDAAILLPALSGLAFLTGLVLEWSGAGLVATVVFWVGLVLGAWTFVPGGAARIVHPGPARDRTADEEHEEHRPWWRDAAILLPALSGLAFLTGLVLEW
ncbi:hypothetical protein D9B85_14820, partial [Corynebacterium diphtheriae]